MGESILCVHAHPDDEALFTGGLLARAHASGARTAVVTCTWSEGSVRAEELRRSLEILGAGPPRLLEYLDAGFEGANRFLDAPFDEVVGRIVAEIRRFRPDIVATYDAFGTYGHPDHVLAHRATAVAVEAAAAPQLFPEAGAPWRTGQIYYATISRSAVETQWSRIFDAPPPEPGPGTPGMPDEMVDLTLDVSPWFDIKWAALAAHVTEAERGGGVTRFVGLPEDVRRDVFSTEWFVVRRSP